MYLTGSANRVTKLSLRPPFPRGAGHGVLSIFLASELELSHRDAKRWLSRADRDCVAISEATSARIPYMRRYMTLSSIQTT